MKHKKYDEVKILVENNIPVLLVGDTGSGKTSTIKDIAEDLNYKFYCVSMTRQTTLSSLLGFKTITSGEYAPTELRKAIEFGGLLLLDEINAADPNVLLCLNTIENGFIAFPDGIIEVHEDFRLCAASNPESKQFTGRAVLDGSTLDRFDKIDFNTDKDLEKHIVGPKVFSMIADVRKCLEEWNSDKQISMRDSIRLKKRLDLNMSEGFIDKLFDGNDALIESYIKKRADKDYKNQEECKTVEELYENLVKEAGASNE